MEERCAEAEIRNIDQPAIAGIGSQVRRGNPEGNALAETSTERKTQMIVQGRWFANARQVQPRVQFPGPHSSIEYKGGREFLNVGGTEQAANVSDFIVKYEDGTLEIFKAVDFVEQFRDEDGQPIVLDPDTGLVKEAPEDTSVADNIKAVEEAAKIEAAITPPEVPSAQPGGAIS